MPFFEEVVVPGEEVPGTPQQSSGIVPPQVQPQPALVHKLLWNAVALVCAETFRPATYDFLIWAHFGGERSNWNLEKFGSCEGQSS
jgi:hypothetical protein